MAVLWDLREIGGDGDGKARAPHINFPPLIWTL